MGFNDIIKKSFLDGFSSYELSTSKILVALCMALAIGVYIFAVYRITTRKAFYSKSFNISLVLMTVVTAAIILSIQSSVVISLGMVGALSIVRFRTAVKDPMDLMFLFWAIATGIICGTDLYELAIITAFLVTFIVIGLGCLPVREAPMLLVINADELSIEQELLAITCKYTKYYKVKSRNLSQDGIDMIIELRTKKASELVQEVYQLPAVISASLLSHDGDVTY